MHVLHIPLINSICLIPIKIASKYWYKQYNGSRRQKPVENYAQYSTTINYKIYLI